MVKMVNVIILPTAFLLFSLFMEFRVTRSKKEKKNLLKLAHSTEMRLRNILHGTECDVKRRRKGSTH